MTVKSVAALNRQLSLQFMELALSIFSLKVNYKGKYIHNLFQNYL